MNKKIYIAVLDFSTSSVVLGVIEKDEVIQIRKEIDAEDDDEIVVEFMSRKGHRESECQYLFSHEPLTVFTDDQQDYQ